MIVTIRQHRLVKIIVMLIVATALSAVPAPRRASARGAAPNLYDLMLTTTEREAFLNRTFQHTVEAPLKRFLSAVASAPRLRQIVYRFEVDQALRPELRGVFCAGKTHRPAQGLGKCNQLAQDILMLARREEKVRALGRDLQAIADSYERPLDTDVSGAMILQVQSITHLWRAGSGAVTVAGSGAVLRAIPLPETPELRQKITTLGKALSGTILTSVVTSAQKEKNVEEFTGTVWRYRSGYALLSQPCAQALPPRPGSELYWTEKRNCQMEAMLLDLAETARQVSRLTFAMGERQVVQWIIPPSYQELMPGNVLLWIRAERWPHALVPRGADPLFLNAGFAWQYAVEPVLPSLCGQGVPEDAQPTQNRCQPIAGGLYPPLPPEHWAVCEHPIHRQGYLCRPLQTREAAICKEQVRLQSNTINIASCTENVPERRTSTGPDACVETSWSLSPQRFDPARHCDVEIKCDNSPDIKFDAKTHPKTTKGIISISIKENTGGSPPSYLIRHELVHARQLCDLPPGTNYTASNDNEFKLSECCRMEYEGNRTQCQAMDEDGVLRPGGQETLGPGGIPMNVETCAQAATDAECRAEKFGACPESFSFTKQREVVALFVNAIGAAAKTNPLRRPLTCQETIGGKVFRTGDNLHRIQDPFIRSQLQQISQIGREVCDPLRVTSYENTIGNNLCYLDRCLEESLENHRLMPGRNGFTVQDQAFPFDAGGNKYPEMFTPVASPSAPLANFPPYRPAQLLQQMDIALCQLNGLPPQTPPAACGFIAKGALLGGGKEILQIVRSLSLSQQQLIVPATGIERMSDALGMRIGTALYGPYLQRSAQALTEVVNAATAMLQSVANVDFSRTMCPLNASELQAPGQSQSSGWFPNVTP
ncbi:MAG: hypothetical protein Greene041619_468 [Candidatus Peregrinibacteria bacterium Greene0416_19]|nr:MAG: hypothetical protein Greene041619_468 [Candidatus Peregrinibacteria bacterium Greene0416_19]